MKKNLYFVTGLLVSITILTSAAYAQQTIFTIGVEAQKYYPQYDNENGTEYFGLARDLLDMFAKEKNYQFFYKIRPVKRLFHEFVEKKAYDFKYPDNPYWQSDMKKGKNIVYSDSVVKYIDGVLANIIHKNI